MKFIYSSLKKAFLYFSALSFSMVCMDMVFAESLCKIYTHWNCKDPQEVKVLKQIESFIAAHPQRGIAAFDWDGTLYNENIPHPNLPNETESAQSIWHIWGANHLTQYPFLFPAFKDANTSSDKQAMRIQQQNAYLEGKLVQFIEPGQTILSTDYDKFSQLAKFESGMTLTQMQYGVNIYLRDYPPQSYAFKKMLDIVQRFSDVGFEVWLISASNTYFLANLLNADRGVNALLHYNLFKNCQPHKPLTKDCHIAGNASVPLPKLNQFSSVYDEKFFNKVLLPNQLAVVIGYGKQLVLQQREQETALPAVFFAGNSDGDYYAMNYILSKNENTMGMFVQTSPIKHPKLTQLLNSKTCKFKCIAIENP